MSCMRRHRDAGETHPDFDGMRRLSEVRRRRVLNSSRAATFDGAASSLCEIASRSSSKSSEYTSKRHRRRGVAEHALNGLHIGAGLHCKVTPPCAADHGPS